MRNYPIPILIFLSIFFSAMAAPVPQEYESSQKGDPQEGLLVEEKSQEQEPALVEDAQEDVAAAEEPKWVTISGEGEAQEIDEDLKKTLETMSQLRTLQSLQATQTVRMETPKKFEAPPEPIQTQTIVPTKQVTTVKPVTVARTTKIAQIAKKTRRDIPKKAPQAQPTPSVTQEQ